MGLGLLEDLGEEVSEPIIAPKSITQQQQIGRVHQRLFELSLRCVEVLEGIFNDPDADMEDRRWAVKMVLERTIPTVSRVQQTNVNVNMGTDEGIAEAHRRALAVLSEGDDAPDARIH